MLSHHQEAIIDVATARAQMSNDALSYASLQTIHFNVHFVDFTTVLKRDRAVHDVRPNFIRHLPRNAKHLIKLISHLSSRITGTEDLFEF